MPVEYSLSMSSSELMLRTQNPYSISRWIAVGTWNFAALRNRARLHVTASSDRPNVLHLASAWVLASAQTAFLSAGKLSGALLVFVALFDTRCSSSSPLAYKICKMIILLSMRYA